MKECKILFPMLVVTICFGCKPTDDRVPRADQNTGPRVETSASASNVPAADRTTTEGKLSASLKEIDATMANLKARAKTAGDQAKAEWEARRPQLEAQREVAAKKLDELKAASKDTWDETRTKTEAAFGELEKGFKEAWAKLKE